MLAALRVVFAQLPSMRGRCLAGPLRRRSVSTGLHDEPRPGGRARSPTTIVERVIVKTLEETPP